MKIRSLSILALLGLLAAPASPARADGLLLSSGAQGMAAGALLGSVFGPDKDHRIVNAVIGGVAGLLLGNQHALAQRESVVYTTPSVAPAYYPAYVPYPAPYPQQVVSIPGSSAIYSGAGQLTSTYAGPVPSRVLATPLPAQPVYGYYPVSGYVATPTGYAPILQNGYVMTAPNGYVMTAPW